jgi:hypothetical protein
MELCPHVQQDQLAVLQSLDKQKGSSGFRSTSRAEVVNCRSITADLSSMYAN